METRKINTRFMQGNKTSEVFDLMADHYGIFEVCESKIDYSEAIFSDGFILAMERDMMPILGSEEISFTGRKYGEFHHLIYNDECYKVYFEEIEE